CGVGIDKVIDGNSAVRCVTRADAERRIRRSRKVDVKPPRVDLILHSPGNRRTADCQKVLRSSDGGRTACAKRSGYQTVCIPKVGWGDRKRDGACTRGSRPVQHCGAIERIDADAVERGVVAKHIDRKIVRIRPETEFGIVSKKTRVRWIGLQRVKPPAA